ncbi:MAG: manganese efflux pump MntP family protein [Firmicutes bacterium]|nr:manganese efflux pump MntP family protein [Bacillota bacterium]
MSYLEIAFLALGLAADSLVVCICLGVGVKKSKIKLSLMAGLLFSVAQIAFLSIGYYAAILFAQHIKNFAYIIAFVILLFLGAKMLLASFKTSSTQTPPVPKTLNMWVTAVATSVDALAVGVAFAFLQVKILPAILLIGFITFLLSVLGVKVGAFFGLKFKTKAELIGGIVLILIGVKILLEFLGVL